MSASFKSMLSGGTFTFQFDPATPPFVVHRQPIAAISPPLNVLMNNGAMLESLTGVAKLEDVEADTFALFVEFAYTGVYLITPNEDTARRMEFYYELSCEFCDASPPPGIAHGLGKPPSLLCDVCECSLEPFWHKNSDKTMVDITWQPILNSGDSGLARDFLERKYPALGRSHESMRQYSRALQLNATIGQNLISHAKLYVFAQKYMVQPLGKLCLHQLHRNLSYFTLKKDNVQDLEELLVYTYKNTEDQDDWPYEDGQTQDDDDTASMTSSDKRTTQNSHSTEELRDLVMEYALAHAEELTQSETFKKIIQNGGQLATDFWGELERLHMAYWYR